MGNIQKAGAEVAQDLEARQCEEIWGAASSGVVHRNTRQRADIWAVEEDKGKGVAWSHVPLRCRSGSSQRRPLSSDEIRRVPSAGVGHAYVNTWQLDART